MPEPEITSPKNPLVRRFKEAAGGEPPEVMLVDGIKLVHEALEAKLPLVEAAVSAKLFGSDLGKALRRRLEQEAPRLHEVSDAVLERISGVATPQGVSAIFRRPAYQAHDLRGKNALLVVAAEIKDPGNLGAVIRAAEAAGATGVAALAGGADPFRDKALRGSAGSVFRLPTLGAVSFGHIATLLEGLQVVVAENDASLDYWRCDFKKPTALVVGNEAHGVPPELLERATVRVRIPMRPPVESLNVAVAAGVVLFEARRQRS
jgi:TrmH family RNA methyltransferase